MHGGTWARSWRMAVSDSLSAIVTGLASILVSTSKGDLQGVHWWWLLPAAKAAGSAASPEILAGHCCSLIGQLVCQADVSVLELGWQRCRLRRGHLPRCPCRWVGPRAGELPLWGTGRSSPRVHSPLQHRAVHCTRRDFSEVATRYRCRASPEEGACTSMCGGGWQSHYSPSFLCEEDSGTWEGHGKTCRDKSLSNGGVHLGKNKPALYPPMTGSCCVGQLCSVC